MGKIYVLAVVALSMVACAGTPLVITASSGRSSVPERTAQSDRNAQERPAPSDRNDRSNRPAPPTDSVMLGQQDVDFNVDHDTIDVRNNRDTFQSLFFVVENNDIELFNIVIDFGNGQKQSINSRLIFNEGSRSRQIDLDGRDRQIRSIQFTYKTVGSWQDGKARVVVYGVK